MLLSRIAAAALDMAYSNLASPLVFLLLDDANESPATTTPWPAAPNAQGDATLQPRNTPLWASTLTTSPSTICRPSCKILNVMTPTATPWPLAVLSLALPTRSTSLLGSFIVQSNAPGQPDPTPHDIAAMTEKSNCTRNWNASNGDAKDRTRTFTVNRVPPDTAEDDMTVN